MLLVVLLLGLAGCGRVPALAHPGAAPTARTSAPGSPAASATARPTPSARPTHNPKKKPVRIPANLPHHYRLANTHAHALGKRGDFITYNVRVQKGLPYDPEDTARFIHQTLNDRRGWGRSGRWRLQLVGPGTKADVQIYLVTRKTTDALCRPLRTKGRVSCFNDGRVVLNADRWAYGAKSYGKDLIGYRRNVVNHEFGHALGFGHLQCPGKGKPAPVMMQQTKGLHGCRRNPWPYPNPARGPKH